MLLKLILKNIKNNKFIAFISIFVIYIVIFFSSFLNFIYMNINNILINETIWQNEKKFTLEVKKWHFISSKLGLKQDLSSYYQVLKKDKNIKNIFGIYQVNIPIQAVISFLGMKFKTDIFVFASNKYKQKKDNINIWISPNLLNLYNTQIANNFLPVINKNILSSLKINLNFWKNSFIQYNNAIQKTWYVKKMDPDFPLFWITIPYNLAQNTQKQLWKWSIKLIKIIGYVKKNNYLQSIKEKYKNKLNIQTLDDSKTKINQQTKIVKNIFNVIKYIIYTIMVSFLILLAIHTYNKNEKNIKVLYYHGASFLQRFNIVFIEMLIYFLIAVIINVIIVWIFNKYFIEIINKQIITYGLYGINITWISFLNVMLNTIISFIIIIIVFLGVFRKKI